MTSFGPDTPYDNHDNLLTLVEKKERRIGVHRSRTRRSQRVARRRRDVCPGVTIGDNTVVGSGSVVVKSLRANVLAVGNPCRVVRSLE
jgi:hypothetical protein